MNFTSNNLLRAFSKLTVLSTLFLIFAGALVKSHEVGLSVPDWPTTYGKQMFAFPLSDMVGGIFYEHGHRIVATIVGFFMMVQAIWLGFSYEKKMAKKIRIFCSRNCDSTRHVWRDNSLIFSSDSRFNHSRYFGTNIFYYDYCSRLRIIH